MLPVRLVNKNGEGKLSPMDDDAPAPPSAAPGRGATDAALLAADGGLDAPWARGLGDLQPTGASRRCASRSVARVPCAACRGSIRRSFMCARLVPLSRFLLADNTPFAHWAVGEALNDVPIVR